MNLCNCCQGNEGLKYLIDVSIKGPEMTADKGAKKLSTR